MPFGQCHQKRNFILLSLLIFTRSGEIGVLIHDKDINFENENILIDNTFTFDKNGKLIIGKNTKTGRKQNTAERTRRRTIDFDLFNKEFI